MSSDEANLPPSSKSVAADDASLRDHTDKKPRITYTSEFLLSFSDLDACKKLPAGFDASIPSELHELGRSSDGPGSYSRGSAGRWDTRSSGSSDREGDLPERESFAPERRPANQSKRSWQQSEHDGLLGSGAFPRPAGYVGPLAPKARGAGYQLNRTSEPYQPPRPHKAVPFSKRDHVDSCNDETFGASEYSSEDRAEEERKRRESFELMRKEHQKEIPDKQKYASDYDKEKLGDDIIALLQNSVEKVGITSKNEKADESVVYSVSQEDTSRTSLAAPPPASRPVVPPGFSNAVVEKKLHQQCSSASIESEVLNATSQESFPIGGIISSQVEANRFDASIYTSKSEDKRTSSSIVSEIPGEASISTENAYGVPEVNKNWKDDIVDGYSMKNGGGSKIVNSVGQDNSLSILDQFFGNVLAKNSGVSPTYVENQLPKSDEDAVAPATSISSKFARWFTEEEGLSSKDLLSLIVKSDNIAAPENPVPVASVSNVTSIGSLSPRSPIKNVDAPSKLLPFPVIASAVGISEQYRQGDIPEAVPVIMTCEDLEQCMLAEVNDSSTNQPRATQEHWPFLDKPCTEEKPCMDNNASQHLLSLLQKGTNSKVLSSPMLHIGSADGPPVSEVNGMVNNDNAETMPASGKSVRLESLFGAAFMNELHSMEAPVSVRGSAAGGPTYDYDVPSTQGLPFAEAGQSLRSSNSGEYLSDEQMLRLNQIQEGAVPHVSGTGIEYRSLPFEAPSLGNAAFVETGLEIQLPEEDNLITLTDSLEARNPDRAPFVKLGRVGGLFPEQAVEEVNYKFHHPIPRPRDAENIQALGRDSLLSHSRVPLDQANSENLYHPLQGGLSSQLHHLMNSARPVFPNPDRVTQRNQQAQFDIPEAIHHRSIHQFPGNMNPMQHGPNFDPAAHHAMLQQMHVPGNFPPQFSPQLLPRGVPPSQPMHHVTGYRPEMNNVNNLHMHPRQPNYEFGMTIPGPGPSTADLGGSHPPEAFERLMQMERRARTKQLHPAAMAGQVPGIYGPEPDMNFRYR